MTADRVKAAQMDARLRSVVHGNPWIAGSYSQMIAVHWASVVGDDLEVSQKRMVVGISNSSFFVTENGYS